MGGSCSSDLDKGMGGPCSSDLLDLSSERKAKLLAEMKKTIGIEKDETRLELAHCDKENTVRTRDVRESNGETVFIFGFTIKITFSFNHLLNTTIKINFIFNYFINTAV